MPLGLKKFRVFADINCPFARCPYNKYKVDNRCLTQKYIARPVVINKYDQVYLKNELKKRRKMKKYLMSDELSKKK